MSHIDKSYISKKSAHLEKKNLLKKFKNFPKSF